MTTACRRASASFRRSPSGRSRSSRRPPRRGRRSRRQPPRSPLPPHPRSPLPPTASPLDASRPPPRPSTAAAPAPAGRGPPGRRHAPAAAAPAAPAAAPRRRRIGRFARAAAARDAPAALAGTRRRPLPRPARADERASGATRRARPREPANGIDTAGLAGAALAAQTSRTAGFREESSGPATVAGHERRPRASLLDDRRDGR